MSFELNAEFERKVNKMGMPEESEYQLFKYICPQCKEPWEEANSVRRHADRQVCPQCTAKNQAAEAPHFEATGRYNNCGAKAAK